MKRLLSQACAIFIVGVLAASGQASILRHIKKPAKHHKAEKTGNPLADNLSKQPDKQLYDKAMAAMKSGKFDVARLDLQTLLNTYPESEYQMRAKLAVGDSWYKEGGSAALTQAEAEYKDFITFFPNQPEAAEAQMRVADIYYQQMQKPDRDPTNTERAEQEYRTMIQQFPDSTLVPRAKQKLREVQEVMADRQFEVGTFYASHENWPATIARLQTLTDRYPLYSHSDLALINLGDAYAAEARQMQSYSQLPGGPKQQIMKILDDRAAEAYGRVVMHYPMAAHVEDARERLIALNRPVPEPTQQELAESEAQEQSRVGVTLKDRALFLVKRGPVTVSAARVGDPTMTDSGEVLAPDVVRGNLAMYEAGLAGKPIPQTSQAASATVAKNDTGAGGDSGAPMQLENVPSADAGTSNGPAMSATIVTQGADSATPANGADPGAGAAPATPAAAPAETSDAAVAAKAAGVPGAENPGGLAAVGPDNKPLPAIEKPAEAPPQVNDVHGNAPQVQTGTTTGAGKGKKKAPKYDSGDESSSKHKKKKGLDKLNPF